MLDVTIPQPMPVRAWVRCEEAMELGSYEAAGLVKGVEQDRIVIAAREYFDLTNGLVLAVKLGAASDDDEGCLIDLPSGERMLISEDLIEATNGDPV